MNPERLQAVVQDSVETASLYSQWETVVFVLVVGLSAYLGSYLKEKGKSAATKEDIEDVTERVESVKVGVDSIRNAETARYQLKYEGCLLALDLIDAHLSHQLEDPEGRETPKQTATTKQARECHNKLIISCQNAAVVELFCEIMFGAKPQDSEEPPTQRLNRFRNLVRKELFDGEPIDLDEERAWFGKASFEPEG